MAKTQHGRDLSGEEMAQMLGEFCNAYDKTKMTEMVRAITHREHRTIQQRIMGFSVALIEAFAADEGGHDGRNEATHKLAKKIVDATGDKYDRFLPLV